MEFQPFTQSRDVINQPDALRERMQREGYLFISGLVPAEDARAVYEDILQICREEAGQMKRASPLASHVWRVTRAGGRCTTVCSAWKVFTLWRTIQTSCE